MSILLKVADRLYGWAARWWIIVLYLVLFIASFQWIGVYVAAFEAASGGMSLLEVPTVLLQPDFDPYQIASQYPPEAVAIYRDQIQLLDFAFPLLAGLFFGTCLYTLVITLTSRQSHWRALGLLGLGMTLFDYMENIGVSGILRTIDAPVPLFSTILSIGIVLKFVVGISAILCVLIVALLLLVQRMRSGVRRTA